MTTSPDKHQVLLSDNVATGKIHINLDAYIQFCEKMDQQLEKLVDRWKHTAAPRAVVQFRD
ncbi:MAG: hypothetical protein ACI9G1_002680 [Pirellulaceae bacterium]|jgi:hypothetical protein